MSDHTQGGWMPPQEPSASWWVTTMPALAIILTGTALSLIGDGLAQRLGQNRRSLM